MGKAWTLFFIAASLAGCTHRQKPSGEIRIVLSQNPGNLIPRDALDAASQRLGSLIFRGLTRLDPDLQPVPDLASRWHASRDGKKWTFWVRPGLKDQGGQAITPERLASCLEQYRVGKPRSILEAAFPSWVATRVKGDRIELELDEPDVYLPRNVSLLRYFRSEPAGAGPCAEPSDSARIIASGGFRMEPWQVAPETEALLVSTKAPNQKLRFSFVRDDSTLALKLLRGDADASQNSLSLAKTRWLERKYPRRFSVIERDGVNVSYLAFNLRDPILGRREVRQAIAAAIPREEIVTHKFFGLGSIAGSLLSPLLPESQKSAFAFDPSRAARLLDRAGFKVGPDGIRFHLKYRTTPVRAGIELAMMVRDALSKIGIQVDLEVVEPGVFLAAIRKGRYQLYSSRWIGVADGSILYRTLHTGQPLNRVGYSNPEVDRLLDLAGAEPELTRRLPLLKKVQEIMARDLPYFPLWYWKNALIVRKELVPRARGITLSLSGALDPLVQLLPDEATPLSDTPESRQTGGDPLRGGPAPDPRTAPR